MSMPLKPIRNREEREAFNKAEDEWEKLDDAATAEAAERLTPEQRERLETFRDD